MSSAAKAWVQLAVTVLAAIVPALATSPHGAAAWVNVVILAAGAVSVYTAANLPGYPVAKTIASAVSAAGVVLASSLSGGIDLAEGLQMVLAVAGVLGVYVVPNSVPAPAAHEAP